MDYLTDPLERAASMTKIEHFAALAMVGLLAGKEGESRPEPYILANLSLAYAKALVERVNAEFRSGSIKTYPNTAQSGTFADWCVEENLQASAAKDDL